ncbi:lipopolysaccharide biosynthesis protein [Bacillus sp. FJAT-27986]|uniref:lipopolysaccharide biosynthesis protein n=1 Tax=Bacillus sp. FJAT-27986 TaxID=1743146 RepID=UPI00080ACCB7|nr:oligosaccharide flippase family protein [Bacillus sp. FJAT-27986]OCA84627.1 polysaccharide biosynthesis protein [Bacillus sp. FJAT-27986]
MKKFINSFLLFSMGPVIGAIISIVTIPLTTYFISPEEFGKSSMFTLFLGLIVTVLYLGIDQAYTREFHESNNRINLLKNAMLLPLLISVFLFIIIIFNLNFVSNVLFGSPEYKFAALLFGVTIIFMVLERFIMLSIRMEEKALEYSILNIILKLNILILTLFFVFFIRRDFLTVVYSTVFGQILADMYLIIRYRVYLDFRKFKFDKSLVIKLVKFGAPLIIAASFTRLLNSMDRIALRTWSDFYEIGIFTAALKVSATLTIIQTSFTAFWTPIALRWHKEKKNPKNFELVSNSILLLLSFLFCLILIFKDYIVLILLGSKYMDATTIIGLLCLYPIMYTLSETTTLGIIFSRKTHYNIWVSILSIIPNILLNIVLVPYFGAVGAAIATGFSYIVFFVCRSYFSSKNWVGFSVKPHIIITAILFMAAIINAQNYNYSTYINLAFLVLIIIIQIPTIKKLISFKKDNDYDFK